MEGRNSRIGTGKGTLDSSPHFSLTCGQIISSCKIVPVNNIPEKSAPSKIVTSLGVVIESIKKVHHTPGLALTD